MWRKRGRDRVLSKQCFQLADNPPFGPGLSAARRVQGLISGTISADLATILAYLPAMQQDVVKDHAGHHRFAHGDRADTHTRIMAALGHDLGRLA